MKELIESKLKQLHTILPIELKKFKTENIKHGWNGVFSFVEV